MNAEFQFGICALNERGYTCCGKPVGCTMTHEGCAYLRHPWKRAMVLGEPDVRCQATRVNPGTNEGEQCVLVNGHDGACDPQPLIGVRDRACWRRGQT